MNVRMVFPKKTCHATFSIEDFPLAFDSHQEIGEYFHSPVVLDVDGFQWKLKIYPAGRKREVETGEEDLFNYMSIYWMRCDNLRESIKAKIKVTIIKNDTILKTLQWLNYHQFPNDHSWGWQKGVSLALMAETPDGPNILTFQAEATIAHCKAIVYENNHVDTLELKKRHTSILIADFKELLTSGDGTDVTLVVGDEERQAHKLILSARSSVLKAIFDSGMQENQTGRIECPDSPEVIDAVLLYIYTGYIGFNENSVVFLLDVLSAAHRLNIMDLVKFCESVITEKLTVKSVCAVASRAELLSLHSLKEAALDYIFGVSSRLIEVQQSKNFSMLSVNLVRDILARASGKKRTRKRDEILEFPCDTNWQRLRKTELMRACKERKLSLAGTKADLIRYLNDFIERIPQEIS